MRTVHKISSLFTFFFWFCAFLAALAGATYVYHIVVLERTPENDAGLTLQTKTWVWQRIMYTDGRSDGPIKEGTFTITFGDKDKFSATTDCNQIAGTFRAEGKSLTFSDMSTSRKFCAATQEKDFIKFLTNTASYRFDETGELILELSFRSGDVVFK